MEVRVTKSVEVRFVYGGKFLHPDKTVSLHYWGRVREVQTNDELGIGLHTHTRNYGTSFAANKKDFDHAFRVDTRFKYLVCKSFSTGVEYAMEKEKAVEIADIRGEIPGQYGPFYLFLECDFTGEDPLDGGTHGGPRTTNY